MFFPTFYYNIGIIVDNSLDFLHVTSFNVLFIDKDKLVTIPIKLCHAVITFNMNVHGLVFSAIKEKRESKKTKYFGHNSDCFYVYDANIGIIFNTTKFSSIKSCFRDYFTKLVRESHKAASIDVEKLAYARLFKIILREQAL